MRATRYDSAMDLTAFEGYLKARGHSPRTRSVYLSYASAFAGADPAKWLDGFVAAEKDRHGEPRTGPVRNSTLRVAKAALSHWIVAEAAERGERLSRRDVRDSLGEHKGAPERRRVGMGQVEFKKYLRAAEECEEPTRTILTLLPYTGLRIFEACKLRLDDVPPRFASDEIRVVGKGAKERRVMLGEVALDLLATYLKDVRPVLAVLPEQDEFIFPGRRTPYIRANRVRDAWCEMRDAKGLPDWLTPHVCRHTAASRMVEQGVPVSTVRDLLGHTNVATLDRYLHDAGDARQRAARALDGLG